MKPIAIAAVSAAAFLFSLPSAAADPDLILHGGKIVTVDEQFRTVQAVAIADGRILATGDDAEIRALAGADTRQADLQGRTVLPGLIDNHNHFIRATEHWATEVRLDGVTHRSRALEMLAERARTLRQGKWLYVMGGWHEDQFVDSNESFTLEELDAVSATNPIFIQAKYSHAMVNSAWFAVQGIPVRAEPGQVFEGLAGDVQRDEYGVATGMLTGGMPMVSRAIDAFPPVTEEEQVEGIKAAMQFYNGLGLTAVYDPGGLGIQDASYGRLQKLADAGEFTLRIAYTIQGNLMGREVSFAQEVVDKINTTTPFQGDEWYNLIAVGENYYSPFHFDNLVRTVDPRPEDIEAAMDIMKAAAARGWSVQTHATQVETIDLVLDTIAEVNKTHPVRALRWSLTHADFMGAPQWEKAKALGVNVQLRSQRVIGGFGEAMELHGDKTLYMPDMRVAENSGAMWGIGTDGTKAAQINPFVSLWWATTGKMLDGTVVTAETLTREEALIRHTRTNAFMMFMEDYLGAIRPGFAADLVVLDRDYLTVPVDEIKDIRPVATVVAGRVVYGEL